MIGGPLMAAWPCHASGLLAAMPRLVQAPIGLLDKGSVLATVILLFAGHALCDYAGQGPFMSDAKNHRLKLAWGWKKALFAHASIHAGMVLWITGSTVFALSELVIHMITDWAKSEELISANEDQGIHYACKVIWAVL